ncbi:hypothetical protein TVAG_483420 [Trichomonas vaginalis G3]|uniref:Uncharacterized protein n=1 Tax=Trichomonas vaginalis (strain ATCC PRA-98 / G3) TaxID=412133 RepID=A2ETB4_TRIV3|nr:hypothetical protein TVAGG3_0620390 [Trichomonas vaginalis G3]EAY04104.1 hypothetical protein TVAG_483420 [Trichomonas vaginalis G3]KAI5503855.1 hypothetical protein TVAGG3_0620390 [Trichomonas vaginalis G3]|eukprot:XP_001316327.1 hypothetical protein [Trichomonas vaginalis G3]
MFQVGWYMNTPTDLKKSKQKPTLRWVTVNEYWLEISVKPLEPPLITIHLGFVNFRPGNAEDALPINSLVLNTFGPIGEWQIFISTNNRFEILDFYEALVKGRDCWNTFLSSDQQVTTFESSFKDKNIGFLGGRSVECNLSPSGFKTMRSQTESTLFKYSDVVYLRPVRFDTRQGACFEMVVKASKQQRSDLLFQCHDHAEMKKFITIFLYNLNQIGSDLSTQSGSSNYQQEKLSTPSAPSSS